jgi:hypothetical protein
MNGHPGSNCSDVARFERIILLLEISHRLTGTYTCEAHKSQHEKQEQAEQTQLDTFVWRNQLQVAFTLALTEGAKKIYRISAYYV